MSDRWLPRTDAPAPVPRPEATPAPLHALASQDVGPLLARLLAIADDAVVVTDAEQCIVLFNDGAERIFGHPMAAVLGRPLALLLPAAAVDGHAEQLRRFAASPTAARRMGERRELQGRRADGTLFDAEASIAHVELGGRLYFAAILRDVTEAREASRALARSEARLRELAATAPVGIFQTDAAGGCRYVNARWMQMAGMTAAEAAGAGWQRAIHPADRARVDAAWRVAVGGGVGGAVAGGPTGGQADGQADGQFGGLPSAVGAVGSMGGSDPDHDDVAFDLRYRFLRPDGTETWVVGRARISRDADGRPSGLLGTVTDVTEAHRQALELERAKTEAEAAVRAKSLFLANMSHEIRTPLNAVIGMTTLLLDTPLADEQLDFARTLRASGESLLEIVNDILDFSKADVGKLELEQQAFDLRRCVEASLDQVAPRALDKRLNLACLIDEATPERFIGDATRIRQVLVNLLSNAVKFTHQGEVSVVVDSAPVVGPGEAPVDAAGVAGGALHRLRLAVHDTGIGIAPEHLPRLFESFSQVDASTTRRFGGTGLGLAISQRLASMMGGAIGVQSQPGEGSVFRLSLPLRAAPAEPQAGGLPRQVPALAGKRLLIVGDNATNRRVLTRLALRWGLRPSTLPSPPEALDRIRHGEPYDLAVLDLGTPGCDGMDLALELRRHRGPAALPIVLLTALGQRHGAAEVARAGLAARLAKPIQAQPLCDALIAALRGQASAAPAAAPVPITLPLAASLPLRVLVAEDNPVNQRVALRLLQRLGYTADVATTGLEVLEAVERQDYAVVLMDIQMPEMDGLQAARQIVQQRGAGGRPRIVAMTANAMPGDREAYLAAGMDGYVAKPIELDALADALRRAGRLLPVWPASASAGLDTRQTREIREGGENRAARATHDPRDFRDAIDPRRLAHLHSLQAPGQPSLVGEVIDLFLADTPAHLATLRRAAQAGDAAELARVAHRLLSITENLGAPRLSALCIEVERAGRQGDAAAGAALLDAIDDAHAQAGAALRALRPSYGASTADG